MRRLLKMGQQARTEAMVGDGGRHVHIEGGGRTLREDGGWVHYGCSGRLLCMKKKPSVAREVEVTSVVVALDVCGGHGLKILGQADRPEGVVAHLSQSFEIGGC